jgi:hypothetical protein
MHPEEAERMFPQTQKFTFLSKKREEKEKGDNT